MVRLLISTARQLALKIASYGVMHLVVAILVAFAITRDWRMALAVGVVEPFFQTIAYSIHDRVWHRIERRGHIIGWRPGGHRHQLILSSDPQRHLGRTDPIGHRGGESRIPLREEAVDLWPGGRRARKPTRRGVCLCRDL